MNQNEGDNRKSAVISLAIEYIMQHIEEEIRIEDVAEHCHFSKFYFSRMFKSEMGESMYAFIKRVRLEQSAFKIKVEGKKTITDIGLEYGYSPSNFSSAFKQYYHMSPADFRQQNRKIVKKHPFLDMAVKEYPTFQEYNSNIRIVNLEDFYVLYERRVGNYCELGKNWADFVEGNRDKITEQTRFIEMSYDDPTITDVNQCLYDICMTVEPDCGYDHVKKIQGGKYAVYHFEGKVEDIFACFQGIFNIWLGKSGYSIASRYGLDIYESVDCESSSVKMDICIPVE